MKKPLKIILIVLGIGLLTLVGWLLIRTGENQGPGEALDNLLPFGFGDEVGQSGSGLTTEEENDLIFDDAGVPRTNLFRISDTPVAGAVALTRADQTVVRYVERATGHVVEVILPQEEKKPVEKRKITNITMPKIYEAHFRSDGGAILLRSLRNDLDTQSNTGITLSAPTGTTTDGLYGISATVFRGDIGSVTVQGSSLFYSLKDSKTIVTSNFSSGTLRTILSSPFTEWHLKPAGNNILIYTKAAEGVMGYAYLLNTTNGALTKVLGPLEALAVTPNQAGTRLAYSHKEGGLVVTKTKNLQANTTLDLTTKTLAEKCTWSPTNQNVLYCGVPITEIGVGEPDNWYAGVSNFTDRIWSYDTNNETAEVISEPEITQSLELDVYRPQISPLGDYLIFTNKRDLSLWALKLE